MILTTLADYAKQKGITRARAYQLKPQLKLIDLPVYADNNGVLIPLYKDNQPLIQTFVQQDKQALEAELSALKACFSRCSTHEATRTRDKIRAIENILK